MTAILFRVTRCRYCDSPSWSELSDCYLCGAAVCDLCATNFTPAVGRDKGRDLYLCERCTPEFTQCSFCGCHRKMVIQDRKLNRQSEAVCCETRIEDYWDEM